MKGKKREMRKIEVMGAAARFSYGVTFFSLFQTDDDAEGAKSGERLFKMMVDLAEHPAQWQKVHQELSE
jgi:hypothetical protein